MITVGSSLSGAFFEHDEAQSDINEDGEVGAEDIDLMYDEVHQGTSDLEFDLNHDDEVDEADVGYLIDRVLNSVEGDANLDGLFDSSDLIEVLQYREYEDLEMGNSTWATGDWNGDRDFNSSDLIDALQHGRYEQTAGPLITSPNLSFASVAMPYSFQVTATGNPAPRYELIQAQEGMQVDPLSGQLNWTPRADQQGSHTVTVRAANLFGQIEQSFALAVAADGTKPTAPENLHVTSVSTDSVSLAWNASSDNVGVDHYAVFRVRRCGFRGIKTCFSLVQDDIQTASTAITVLDPLSWHKLAVRAVDAADNVSLTSKSLVFQTQGAPSITAYARNADDWT